MSLSERIRPDSEVAPWVYEEVKQIEDERDRLAEDCRELVKVLELMLQRYGYETCEYVQKSTVLINKIKERS